MESYNRQDDNTPFRGNNRIIIGTVLILAGLALVVRNTGIIPHFIDSVIFSWQMLLIAIGFVIMFGSGNKTPGIIMMAVGGFFLVPEILHETWKSYRLFWPAIFIIIGAIFVINSRSRRIGVSTNEGSDSYIDLINIFGGGERRITSPNFMGGKITSIFGGGEVDLTKAVLASGTSEIEIICVFGGTSIIVPPDWNVKLDVVSILGGFSDERKLTTGQPTDPGKTLIIKGVVVFGGGDIKSY